MARLSLLKRLALPMNYPSPEKLAPLADSNQQRQRLLLAKVEALKETLDNFTVIDRHGKSVGDVRNLVLHQRQLSLLIVQPDAHRYWRFVPLSSRLVKQISLRDRAILVKTTQSDISYLPEYRTVPRPANVRSHTSAQTPNLAPDRHLTTAATAEQMTTERLPQLEFANGSVTRTEPARSNNSNKQPLQDAPATPKVLSGAVKTVDVRSPNAERQPVTL